MTKEVLWTRWIIGCNGSNVPLKEPETRQIALSNGSSVQIASSARPDSPQIREWGTHFDEPFSDLQKGFSVFHNAQQIALSAPQRPEALLQPVPELGFVGLGIQDAETMFQKWLNMEDHQFRVTGICGLGGIGKTSLLRRVYNTCKQGNVFPAIISITVSPNINILNMQSDIAEAMSLNLGGSSNAEMRKIKLFVCLKENKFVKISTRSIEEIRKMGANDYFIQIEPLSEDEGWELFSRKALEDGGAPINSIEDVARLIAGECKGMPLAINVVAAAMKGNVMVDEWNLALFQIKNVDSVLLTYTGIDEGLYQRLKWSNHSLPNSHLQNCFLYYGAFPEDAEIDVESLVEMWIAEGLFHCRETSYLMDIGRGYVKLMVERCLFEDIHGNMWSIKVHDVVSGTAIYIAKKKENCFLRTSQNLQNFPVENEIFNSKRISMGYNNIPFLPTDLTCSKLLALFLTN